jgi:hypothetical protein
MPKYRNLVVSLMIAAASTAAWAGKTPANKPPTVSITAPATGATFAAPATIAITATAADSDGSVAKVDFTLDGALIGTSTTAPYHATATNVFTGTHTLRATATDNLGLQATASVSVTVTGSNIVLSSPANGAVTYNGYIQVAGQFAGDSATRVWVNNDSGTTRLATISGGSFSTYLPVVLGPNNISISVMRTDKTSDATGVTVNGANYPQIAVLAPVTRTFNTPANVTIAVDALSPAGSIAKVSFFNGSTLLGSATAPPYQYVWNNVPKGEFSIVAQAFDNQGYSATASIPISVLGPNAAPVISLSSPSNNAVFAAPATIPLIASATDSDGTVTQVDFYQNGVFVGASNVAPYALNWQNVPVGTYAFLATATDNSGAQTTSAPVNVTVTPPNAAPAVALTAPADNAQYVAGTAISLSATASDSDGSISRVEFYKDASLLGTANGAPYVFSWIADQAGTFTLTARAFDNLGASTVSAPVHVSVTPPPPVYLSSPANNSSFTAPGPVTITVNANAGSATVARIDILDGSTLLSRYVPPAPYNALKYNFSWNATTGSHTLTAVVTDSLNASFVSSVVTVQGLDAPLVELAATGSFYLAPGDVDLYASAAPAGASAISTVELYNGQALIASLTAAPFNYLWSNVPAGTYALTAKATDSLGATVSSAPLNITVGTAPSITARAGLDGSSVSDDQTPVSGSFRAPPNSAVSVNGALATVTGNGEFFLNSVPLTLGSNVLTLTVKTMDGQTAAQTITVNRATGPAPFTFVANAARVIDSLSVGFTLTSRANVPVGRVELSCTDGGAVSLTAADIAGVSGATCTYAAPGLHTARVSVFDPTSTLIYTATQSTYMATTREIGRTVRGVYTVMQGRLKGNNIAAALNAFTTDSQPQYNDIFTALGAGLPAAAGQLGQITELHLSGNTAEILLLRAEDGGNALYIVHLMYCQDGIWRIASM